MSITTFALGDYMTNCHVVTDPDAGRACWIVDCGYDPDPLLDWITGESLEPIAVLLTHCHCDHIGGLDRALNRFGSLPIHVHEAETRWNEEPMLNLSGLMGIPISVTAPDHVLHGGETLKLGGSKWRVIHTPGHSPGSVSYVNDEARQALVGDTLFAGSIGRFDFPTSSAPDLRQTVQVTLMELPDDMEIHPGHGPSSTIGRERATNPYVIGGF